MKKNRVPQSQERMFYAAGRKISDGDQTFLEMIKCPNAITNNELAEMVKRRPALWGRYSGFIGKLGSLASQLGSQASQSK